jgi:hypothetical protein
MRAAPDRPVTSLSEFEVFTNVRAYRPDRDIEAGKIQAQEALDEWHKVRTIQAAKFASVRRAEEKEMRWAPTDPIKLHEGRTKRQKLNSAFQRITPFPIDLSEIKEVGRPPLKTFPSIEESNIRLAVAQHENKAVKDAYGKDMETEGMDMRVLSDPFDSPRIQGDEVYAMLQCVRFKGNPAVRTTVWPLALAMINLPYPLSELVFLEDFVKPLFQADDWVKCEYCRTKFGFRELAMTKWDASIDGRLAKCEAIGKRVLAVVDAMEKEWQALFKEVEPEQIALGKAGRLDRHESWAEHDVVYEWNIPMAAYTICRAVDEVLREKVREEAKEHDCRFWRLCREVALKRSDRWMEAQLTAKPVAPKELPMPFDE